MRKLISILMMIIMANITCSAAFADAEIPYDRKKFSPHITLIRKAVCRKGMPGISIPHKSMTVNKITLYRSDRGKHGMIYTELGSV